MTAGFYGGNVTGFDINPEAGRRYPYKFVCADMKTLTPEYLAENFDFLHLGAPCQRWTKMMRCRPGRNLEYPDLITPMRPVLQASGVPYVIENVENAPLVDPVWLCGLQFGRLLYRHRGFEAGNGLVIPEMRHPEHVVRASRAGHWEPGTVMSIAGHIDHVDEARQLMGVTRRVPRDWLREAAPSYMLAYVGTFALVYLSREAALWPMPWPTGAPCCRPSLPAAGLWERWIMPRGSFPTRRSTSRTRCSAACSSCWSVTRRATAG